MNVHQQQAGVAAHMVRRSSERRQVHGVAEARRGMTREKVQVSDLSLQGARLRTLSPIREGTVIFLQIGTLRGIEATVVWSSGFESGCTFASPLYPATFDALTASL